MKFLSLRMKALLVLPISPIWIMGALIIEHWDDVAGCYADIFKAIRGTHAQQLRDRHQQELEKVQRELKELQK